VASGVEEVAGAQVVVAIRVLGVDARDIDLALDA
jgi:hypothetical protein